MTRTISIKQSVSVSTTETNIISPTTVESNSGDIALQLNETGGTAATIRIYGSLGDPTNNGAIPTFNTSGTNYWSQINTDSEGSLSANTTKLMFTPRSIRYITIRGITTSGTSTVTCIASWTL